jgi:undecaprenyl-diphosphatase
MDFVSAALLGIVQGLTEFLPISSSAHLILMPWILGWRPGGLIFDVSLHAGTALAILAYFWRDWLSLARETMEGIIAGSPFGTQQRRLAWFLVVGTIPAVLAGLLGEDYVEYTLRSPLVAVLMLAAFGALLYVADQRGERNRNLKDFTWGDSLWIGLSQALALVPGVSRSGITISVAMLRNVDRTSAARFSFLLSTPVVVGAAVLEGWRFYHSALPGSSPVAPAGISWIVLGMGAGCSAATGFFCIRYFLRYLETRTFTPFVIYRIALAVIGLILYL